MQKRYEIEVIEEQWTVAEQSKAFEVLFGVKTESIVTGPNGFPIIYVMVDEENSLHRSFKLWMIESHGLGHILVTTVDALLGESDTYLAPDQK